MTVLCNARCGNLFAKLSLATFILFGSFRLEGQMTEQKSYIVTDYLLYFPQGYDSTRNDKWPLLIYLHGAGLRERSLQGLKDDYMAWHLNHDKALPFIVVCPLCNSGGWNPAFLDFFLEDLVHKFRIYLTGHSMGGFGTWNWALSEPGKFAAIAPVSGCSSTIDFASAWKLRNMPVWVFHGAKDDIVDIECNKQMVDELNKVSHKVKFYIYPDRGHDTWAQTFSNDELYKWMLEQDRRNNYPVSVNLAPEVCRSYCGKYLAHRDTLTVGYTGVNLFLEFSGNQRINLIAESETIFSFKENPSEGIEFQKEGQTIKGFMVLDESKTWVAKLGLK